MKQGGSPDYSGVVEGACSFKSDRLQACQKVTLGSDDNRNNNNNYDSNSRIIKLGL